MAYNQRKNKDLKKKAIIGAILVVAFVIGDRTNVTSKIPLLNPILDKLFPQAVA